MYDYRIERETVPSLMSTIFWDIRPCSPLKFNQCLGGTYRLYLQGLFDLEDGDNMFL
jgi:hypothetical protein